jgi:hypothetical protein
MRDSGFVRIWNHEIDERRRSIAYLAGLAVAGSVVVVALVVAIGIVGRLVG